MADTTHNLQVRTTVKDLASGELQRLGKTGAAAGKSIAYGFIKAQVALAAMAVAIRGIVNIVRSLTTEFGETADRTAKLARQLGVGVSALSEYGHIAEFAGSNLEDVGKSVRFVQRSLAEAERGTKTYTDVFEKLGMNAADVARLMRQDGVEAFEAVGLAISKLPTHADKVNASMVLLGRAGTSMIPIFDQGSEALRKQREELKKYGVTLTETQGRLAEEFQDARKRFNDSIQGIKNALAERLLPVLTKALNFLAKWVASNRERIVDFFLDLADAMILLGQAATQATRLIYRAFLLVTEGVKPNREDEKHFDRMIEKLEKAREALKKLRDTANDTGATGTTPPGSEGGEEDDPYRNPIIVEPTDWQYYLSGIRKAAQGILDQLTPEALGEKTVTTLTSAWSTFFDTIVFGSGKAEDAFRSMVTSMLRQIANMANSAIIGEIFSALGGVVSGSESTNASTGSDAMRYSSSARSATRANSGGGLVA